MEGALKIEALLSGKWSRSEGGGGSPPQKPGASLALAKGLIADSPRGV